MVLIVGDDPDANELMSRILTAEGYRTAKVGSPDETLQRVGELLPRCIVLNLSTGGVGSNLKVLESIRSSGDGKISSTRVVLIARSANNRVFSFQSGVDEFIVRPFHADDLIDRVDASILRPDQDRSTHRRNMLDRKVSDVPA